MTAAATQAPAPATVTRAMRQLWPAPIRISTKVTNDRVVITGPLSMRDAADAQVQILNSLSDGQTWQRVDFQEVGRGTASARATFATGGDLPEEFKTVGWPADWPAEQADEQTVLARHRMVRELGLGTGHNARPGQHVKHIELGIRGRLDGVTGSSAYVTFGGDTESSLVHAADVVRISDAQLIQEAEEAGEPFIFFATDVTVGEEIMADGAPATVVATDVELNTITVDHGHETTPGCGGSRGTRFLNSVLERGALQKIAPPPAKEAAAALTAARSAAAAANQAYLTAIRGDHDSEDARRAAGIAAALGEQTANISVARAELALDIALGKVTPGTVRFEVTTCSHSDGERWEVIGWGRYDALPSETATAQALRIAGENRLLNSAHLMSPKPWRVQVWTDPAGERPDGEWTNLTDPCPAGEHNPGAHPISGGASRSDGSAVRQATCSICMHEITRVDPYRRDNENPNPWVLAGEALPDPDPAVLYLPVECIKQEHYGMEIHDGMGTWYTLISVGPIDRETGKCEVTVEGRPVAKIYCTMSVQLRPGPIRHEGVAVNEHGAQLVSTLGALHYDDRADETGDGTAVGAWRVTGVGENFQLPVGDVEAAKRWAEAALAARRYGPVVGWTAHRDRYGDLWTPIFDGGGRPERPVPSVPALTGTDGTDGTAGAAADTAPAPIPIAGVPVDRVPIRQDGPVPIGYRIETRTGASWSPVRVGWSPPIYHPARTVLAAVARTILSNTAAVLGLRPQDALPAVRVYTWHRGTGLTGFAVRDGGWKA